MTTRKSGKRLTSKTKHNNSCLSRAKKKQDDEFYTRYEDVERIAKAFKHHLKGKRLYCNCDTEESAFVRYLRAHRDDIGYESLDFSGKSFDDPKNLRKLGACDIVITNPPFSCYRYYLDLLMEHGKDFILIAPTTALQNKEWVKRLGSSLYYTRMKIMYFDRPDGGMNRVETWVISSFSDMDLYADKAMKSTPPPLPNTTITTLSNAARWGCCHSWIKRKTSVFPSVF